MPARIYLAACFFFTFGLFYQHRPIEYPKEYQHRLSKHYVSIWKANNSNNNVSHAQLINTRRQKKAKIVQRETGRRPCVITLYYFIN